MARLRGVLTRITVLWLLCQAAALTVTPAMLWFGAAEALLECQCVHGDHEICPMHHEPEPGSALCTMRSADDTGLAVFNGLWSVGLLPERTTVVVPDRRQMARPLDSPSATLRPAPPDPPPPRA